MNDKWLFEKLSAAEEQLNAAYADKEHTVSPRINRKIEQLPTRQKRFSQMMSTVVTVALVLCLTGSMIDFTPVSGDIGMLHETFDEYGTVITLDADSGVDAGEIRILPEVIAGDYVHDENRSANWEKYFSYADNRSYRYIHKEDESKRMVIYQQSIPYSTKSYAYLEEDWTVVMKGKYRVRYASYYDKINGKGAYISDAYWYEDNCLVMVQLVGDNEQKIVEIIDDLLGDRITESEG